MLKHKSFTLIELLLVIVILGVIAGITLPNFRQTYTTFKLKSTTQQIVSLMRYARSRAIIETKIFQMDFDDSLSSYWLLEAETQLETQGDEASFKNLTGRYGKTFRIPAEVKMEVSSSPVNFFPDGGMDETAITLSSHGRRFVISTDQPMGYLKVWGPFTSFEN